MCAVSGMRFVWRKDFIFVPCLNYTNRESVGNESNDKKGGKMGKKDEDVRWNGTLSLRCCIKKISVEQIIYCREQIDKHTDRRHGSSSYVRWAQTNSPIKIKHTLSLELALELIWRRLRQRASSHHTVVHAFIMPANNCLIQLLHWTLFGVPRYSSVRTRHTGHPHRQYHHHCRMNFWRRGHSNGQRRVCNPTKTLWKADRMDAGECGPQPHCCRFILSFAMCVASLLRLMPPPPSSTPSTRSSLRPWSMKCEQLISYLLKREIIIKGKIKEK